MLGKGGMGTVFLGKHLSLDRMVAIKAMHKSALAEGQELQRFLNEGKALALLRHPSITECYFIGVADGQPYMVMEHLRGK
ncbi:protein kinase domain-containing protein, partial [Enterococcus faecalis]|uniref:protein kinase domain-containing protein n=1 Tax=Enterococcus faecalis TaxID=1351 RepID=UPI00403F0D24